MLLLGRDRHVMLLGGMDGEGASIDDRCTSACRVWTLPLALLHEMHLCESSAIWLSTWSSLVLAVVHRKLRLLSLYTRRRIHLRRRDLRRGHLRCGHLLIEGTTVNIYGTRLTSSRRWTRRAGRDLLLLLMLVLLCEVLLLLLVLVLHLLLLLLQLLLAIVLHERLCLELLELLGTGALRLHNLLLMGGYIIIGVIHVGDHWRALKIASITWWG